MNKKREDKVISFFYIEHCAFGPQIDDLRYKNYHSFKYKIIKLFCSFRPKYQVKHKPAPILISEFSFCMAC